MVKGAHRAVTIPKRRLVEMHNTALRLALDAKFDDGTPMTPYILATNPDLANRLRKALGQ